MISSFTLDLVKDSREKGKLPTLAALLQGHDDAAKMRRHAIVKALGAGAGTALGQQIGRNAKHSGDGRVSGFIGGAVGRCLICTLQKTLQDLDKRLSNTESHVSELKYDVNTELENEIDELKMCVANNKASIATLEYDFDERLSDLSSDVSDNESAIGDLEYDVDDIESDIGTLEHNVSDNALRVHRLEDEGLGELGQEIDDLADAVAINQASLGSFAQLGADLTFDLADVQEAVAENESDIEDNEERITALEDADNTSEPPGSGNSYFTTSNFTGSQDGTEEVFSIPDAVWFGEENEENGLDPYDAFGDDGKGGNVTIDNYKSNANYMKFRKTSIAFAIGYPGIVFIWEEGAASWAPTADQISTLSVPIRNDLPGIADGGTPNWTEVATYPEGIEYASSVTKTKEVWASDGGHSQEAEQRIIELWNLLDIPGSGDL